MMALSELEKMEAQLRFRMVNHGSKFGHSRLAAERAAVASKIAAVHALNALIA